MLKSAKADADQSKGDADMSLGKVIRKYRKIRNLTQEEMAGRLGVTAPAVNKWENENSCPDIALLAPIARLLDISLDTLLSYKEELTEEEITRLVHEADQKLKKESYEDAFHWAKKKLEEYPNCEELILNFAVLFDAQHLVQGIPEEAGYDTYFCTWYTRVLNSMNETIRIRAADALVGFYMRKKQYETAEKYLEYFSVQNPERKRKQAQIYAETERIEEAYKTYEELLFSDFARVSMELHGMYVLAVKEGNRERAYMLVDKQKEAAKCFDMGKYYEVSTDLELAVLEKDADMVIKTAQEMLSSVEQIGNFRNSPLYAHMKFQKMRREFAAGVRENLLKCFREDESFEFLKGEESWEALIRQ